MRALHKLSVRDGKPMIQHAYKIINKPLTLLMFLLLTACNSSDNTVSESSHVDQVVQNNPSSVDASKSTEIVNGEDLTEIGHLPTSNSTILASSDDSELTSEPPTLVAFTEAIASQPEGSSFNEETRDANDSQTSIEESDSISLSPLGDPVALNTAVNPNPEETTTQVSSASNDVLSGAVYPFEKVNFQIANSTEFIKVLYRDSQTAQEVEQPSFKKSNCEFTILAIPLTMEGINTYEVSNDTEYLGKVDILTNSVTARNNNPGQYSLTVLNSLLNGLKDELDIFTEVALESQSYSTDDSLFNKIVPVQQAISNFQELIDVLEQSVSGNGTIVDPSTSQLVVDEAGLETLDGLFHHIVTRYSTDIAFSS